MTRFAGSCLGLLVVVLSAPAAIDSARPPAILTFAADDGMRGGPTQARGGLCFLAPGSGRALRLTGQRDDRRPAWSPDGRYVAFERMSARPRGAISDILVADARGRIVRNVTRATAGDVFNFDPAWAPNRRWIAFSFGFRFIGVFVARPDGRGRRLVTPDTLEHSFTLPAWSPDGERLAVVAGPPGSAPPRPTSIWTVDLDSGRAREILAGANAPAWSPRGSSIAYVAAGVAGAPDVFVADADGTDRRAVTRTPEAESHPAWTPDARRIAFARDDGGTGGSIVVADSDGGSERVAIRSDRYRPVEPAWRPRVAMPRVSRRACS